jgi:hypothetical protein
LCPPSGESAEHSQETGLGLAENLTAPLEPPLVAPAIRIFLENKTGVVVQEVAQLVCIPILTTAKFKALETVVKETFQLHAGHKIKLQMIGPTHPTTRLPMKLDIVSDDTWAGAKVHLTRTTVIEAYGECPCRNYCIC